VNCQPINDKLRYHKINCYALHTSTTRKKRVFEKNLFKCVTRPDLIWVSLRYGGILRTPESSLSYIAVTDGDNDAKAWNNAQMNSLTISINLLVFVSLKLVFINYVFPLFETNIYKRKSESWNTNVTSSKIHIIILN